MRAVTSTPSGGETQGIEALSCDRGDDATTTPRQRFGSKGMYSFAFESGDLVENAIFGPIAGKTACENRF